MRVELGGFWVSLAHEQNPSRGGASRPSSAVRMMDGLLLFLGMFVSKMFGIFHNFLPVLLGSQQYPLPGLPFPVFTSFFFSTTPVTAVIVWLKAPPGTFIFGPVLI